MHKFRLKISRVRRHRTHKITNFMQSKESFIEPIKHRRLQPKPSNAAKEPLVANFFFIQNAKNLIQRVNFGKLFNQILSFVESKLFFTSF